MTFEKFSLVQYYPYVKSQSCGKVRLNILSGIFARTASHPSNFLFEFRVFYSGSLVVYLAVRWRFCHHCVSKDDTRIPTHNTCCTIVVRDVSSDSRNGNRGGNVTLSRAARFPFGHKICTLSPKTRRRVPAVSTHTGTQHYNIIHVDNTVQKTLLLWTLLVHERAAKRCDVRKQQRDRWKPQTRVSVSLSLLFFFLSLSLSSREQNAHTMISPRVMYADKQTLILLLLLL